MRPLCLALSLLAGPALADMSDDIGAACMTASNIPDAVCTCVGARAAEELTADEQAFVLASLTEDLETADALRATMPADSLTRASVFLINAPATCAAG